MSFPVATTAHGFTWGPIEVSRIASDPRFGVVVEIKSGDNVVHVRSSPKGQVLSVDTYEGRSENDD